jgi:hypothetical protein
MGRACRRRVYLAGNAPASLVGPLESLHGGVMSIMQNDLNPPRWLVLAICLTPPAIAAIGVLLFTWSTASVQRPLEKPARPTDPSDPRNLIIGTWGTVEGQATLAYREDGSTSVGVPLKAGDFEMNGTYEFLDNNTLKTIYVINPRTNQTRTITGRIAVTKDELTLFDPAEGPKRYKRFSR